MERKSQKKISVCMATFNGDRFIEKQLLSILSQLSEDDEIIISDDGSTDRTLEIARHLCDERIKIFHNENRSNGLVSNFENALSKVSGEIVFLSDQDDQWLPNKVDEHLKFHSNYDLILSNAMVVNEQDTVIYKSFFDKRRSKKGFVNNLIKNAYLGCCMSFNTKILKLAIPFPNDIHMHDWWIGLIGEVYGKVFFNPTITLKYLRHSGNASQTLVSRSPLSQQFANRFNLLSNILKQLFKQK